VMVASLSAPTLLVVAGSTAVIYGVVIFLLRLAGRRQLGQLTAIDLVVFLTLGSAVETAMIHGDTSLAAGLVSAATLLLLNFGLNRVLLRSRRLRHLVGGGPILLVHDGRLVDEHLRRVGLTDQDVDEALRARGYASRADVRDAVLETDGTINVIPRTSGPPAGRP